MFTPKKFGGLGIPDLKTFWSSLQCSWLKRLHTSPKLWAKILLNQDTPTSMAFLTHNTVALSLRLSNPFWTQKDGKSFTQTYTPPQQTSHTQTRISRLMH